MKMLRLAVMVLTMGVPTGCIGTLPGGTLSGTEANPVESGPGGLQFKGFFREGQTFLTWKEVEDVKGEKYRIYQADKEITADDINEGKARPIAVVPEGSAVFHRELIHKTLEKKAGIKGYGQRFCIVDNVNNDPKKMLPPGTGLLVYTTDKKARRFYAIMPEFGGALQWDRLTALKAGIDEDVMLPGAVIQWKHPKGTAAVYTHWMDYATWDPQNIPSLPGLPGYAFNFGLSLPKDYDGKKPLPVLYGGHGMGGGYGAAETSEPHRCVSVSIDDVLGTWYYGQVNRNATMIVNYAEQRAVRMWQWLKAGRPNQFFKIDPLRAQAYGGSMGGTMALAFGLRMGDIFSSIAESSGATIHRRNGMWVRQVEQFWGPVSLNKATPFGVGVWDHQDYAQWSIRHTKQDSAFLLITHGKSDPSVPFGPVPDFLDALQKSRRPFAAQWDMRGHEWKDFSVRNEALGAFKIPRNESLPAFANASNSNNPRKDNTGTMNANLEWSASGNDFDPAVKADDIVDTEEEYGLNVRSLTGPATVDITPRRLQRFKVRPGQVYRWENIDFSDPVNPKRIAGWTVKADVHGLITVARFQVGNKGLGNRLVIRPQK